MNNRIVAQALVGFFVAMTGIYLAAFVVVEIGPYVWWAVPTSILAVTLVYVGVAMIKNAAERL